MVELVPLTQLCLETDSPVLGYEKNVRNEPANIGISAKFIAEVKGIPIEEVVGATTTNALKVFPMLECLADKLKTSF